ncbi:tRNA pseudouridine(55) synthase TruB [Segniliparus rugosus]|uniref:tRNA pseudouridine synthase B n=1 Tax=Segniliparus rugosus (strain ATCC BAA-974 / DSM 45345 / CCUG 50838 / CIP 108380 / JCM 13579 / CDC 945) TaxID=679197 RepID=E5XPS6_SEGRC|nr:tRNA pseudouridine(55) synthase TruB [Segniliparus rugosus]EFV13674.1 tRNA pseudouridine synthase B [Segniliparus rugosus ATCC BAA-974]
MAGEGGGPHGLVLVDKPQGMTSHDVVARARRCFRTRKVGHAGTLDPMATGVLVLGLGKATRLLGRLTSDEKRYVGTIRLGERSSSDDADGEILGRASTAALALGQVRAGIERLTGEIAQVPPAVSAIKVGGVRAHAAARAGEALELKARQVVVRRFELAAERRIVGEDGVELWDLDVEVDCTAGTYIRSLARDLGEGLGVGGHLTRLRRVASGKFDIAGARPLDALEADPSLSLGLDDAARAAFAARPLTEGETRDLGYGKKIPPVGLSGEYAGFAPDGSLVALLEEQGGAARPSVVFQPAGV